MVWAPMCRFCGSPSVFPPAPSPPAPPALPRSVFWAALVSGHTAILVSAPVERATHSPVSRGMVSEDLQHYLSWKCARPSKCSVACRVLRHSTLAASPPGDLSLENILLEREAR